MSLAISGTKSIIGVLIAKHESSDVPWILPEECPIAICINGETYAVMLATPLNLREFALGFCLSEGIITNVGAIQSINEKKTRDGYEIHIALTEQAAARMALLERRRNLAGTSGCGLCGLTSLSHVVETLPSLPESTRVKTDVIKKARLNLREHTPINRHSFSVHGAAFANLDGDLILVREDVGRHNALDKLIGAARTRKIDLSKGFVLLTSRFAYELVQKCVRGNIPIVASISAPTTFAVELAQKSNMTLIAFTKDDEIISFSGSSRLEF